MGCRDKGIKKSEFVAIKFAMEKLLKSVKRLKRDQNWKEQKGKQMYSIKSKKRAVRKKSNTCISIWTINIIRLVNSKNLICKNFVFKDAYFLKGESSTWIRKFFHPF